MEYLKATYGDKLDPYLNFYEAMQRLFDENLYWAMIYSRWQDPKNWQKTKDAYFKHFPPILNLIIPFVARQQTLRNLVGHGMGKHSAAEIYRIGTTDLTAVSDFLGDKPFLMGEQPTSLDATAYGFLANLLWVPIESPLKESGKSLTNLDPYCQRMKSAFYSN